MDPFSPVPLTRAVRLINHGPCVIVSTGDAARANAAPVQWNVPVNDDPPVLAIALDAGNFTCELLLKTGEFVLNLPEAPMLQAVRALGLRSGREADKVPAAGLTWAPGVQVRTPHLLQAMAYLECRRRDVLDYEGVKLVIGDVVHAAARPERFPNHRLAADVQNLHHLGGGTFALTGERRSPIP